MTRTGGLEQTATVVLLMGGALTLVTACRVERAESRTADFYSVESLCNRTGLAPYVPLSASV